MRVVTKEHLLVFPKARGMSFKEIVFPITKEEIHKTRYTF